MTVNQATEATGEDRDTLIDMCQILKAAIEINFGHHPNGTGLAISACALIAGEAYMTDAIAKAKEPSKAERRRMEKHLVHNFAAGMTVARNRAARLAREGETIQ